MNNIPEAKIKDKKLVNESGILEFINSSDLNEKLKTLAINVEQKAEQDKIGKLQRNESNLFMFKVTFSMIDPKIS